MKQVYFKWTRVAVVLVALGVMAYWTHQWTKNSSAAPVPQPEGGPPIVVPPRPPVTKRPIQLPPPKPVRSSPEVHDFHDTDDNHPKPSCETVHIGMMIAGINATRAGITTIKSVLLHRTAPLHLHFMTDDQTKRHLELIFSTWQLQQVQVSFYLIMDFITEVAWVRSMHESGIFGLSKLTYERAMSNVSRLIALDTDVILASDISLLWQHFNPPGSPVLVSAVAQQSDWYLNATNDHRKDAVWPAIGRGFNTGVLLLDLEKMRATRWRSIWSEVTRQQLEIQHAVGLGDQDIMNLVSITRPELFANLPCGWNVQVHDHADPACYKNQPVHAAHWNSPAKLNSGHPRKAFFADLYWRTRNVDGYRLVEAPIGCPSPQQTVPVSDDAELSDVPLSDDCVEYRRAGQRTFRTHTNFYGFQAQKSMFDCRMTAVEGLPDHLHPKPMKVLSKSHVLAQSVYLKHVRKQKSRIAKYGFSLPESPGAACVEVEKKVDSSSKPDITLVTHLSFERMDALQAVLKQWDGPVSAVVYLRDSDLFGLQARVAALELKKRSQDIAIHVVFQTGQFYPVNYLRNVAINAIRTTHLFAVDVDLVPNHGSYSSLVATLSQQTSLRGSQPTALIVPAFETNDYTFTYPGSKNELLRMLLERQVTSFREKEWPKGHALTQYDEFRVNTGVYSAKWTEGSEPYFVVAKTLELPQYDQRFIGFGWNKVSQVEAMHVKGYSFYVTGNAFLVHLPHAPSPDLHMFRQSPLYKRCLSLFKEEFRAELSPGRQGETGALQKALDQALRRAQKKHAVV